ncbi:threonine-phosphate decarboxylase CobD [Notoacmeibacter ruber]|uniref:threonine-phosphate decarboxylase CobD n=1 Tax=Notoacmeibacter ruber TaxID=2670375 RepID=UPI001FE00753|nr:threonine-phosphate decarboxylase CobD [Notoacmeibacter ruber]
MQGYVKAGLPSADASGPVAAVHHGGDLSEANRLFPDAPKPWIDLSTGISPYPYPLPPFDSEVWTRLPEGSEIDSLRQAAASAYGAEPAQIVPATGTQPLMAALAASVPPAEAAILSPTYQEHARLCMQAGHGVLPFGEWDNLSDAARLVIVVNPNNPTGSLTSRERLLQVADEMERRGGLLVVDEAFMDSVAGAAQFSLAETVEGRRIAVLRSFGKFYGLAGLRLGFAVAGEALANRLTSRLGPWPVSGPAIAVGREALANVHWQNEQRRRLAKAQERLDALLAKSAYRPAGESPLFRTIHDGRADALFQRLGQNGIWVRRFEQDPNMLRLGLPASEIAWERLAESLRR